jgi:hypothetical protein
MDMAFQLGQEDSDIPKLLSEICKGNSELPEGLDLPAKAYDPNATKNLTIREFCLWHASASKPGSPSLITRDADQLISYLNGMSLIETLEWTSRVPWFSHEETHRIEAVLDAIGKCQSLRKLEIFGQRFQIEEVERLCQSLLRNQVEDLTLGCHEGLDIFYPGQWFQVTQTICKMVAMNHNLKHLTFHYMHEHTYAYFGSMLATNSTLESLSLGGWTCHSSGVEELLQPLTGDGENLPLNTTLKRLTINGYATEAIVAMLATNNSLTHLTLLPTSIPSLSSSDVCMIVQSLKTNKTFQKLTIMGYEFHDPVPCHDLTYGPWITHVQGRENVFAAIMDLLQVNPWLKDIDIRALRYAQREAIRAQLAKNLEIVEKMDDFTTSQQIPIEGEVSQRMQEINLFTNLEATVTNLKVSMYKAKPMSSF